MFQDALAAENITESVPVPVTPKKSDSKIPVDCDGIKLDIVPKLTRAKMKDLMEKVNIPLSPAKQQKPGPSILEVEFGEEEDDEEYSPDKDEGNETDDESVASSQLSEFGSPYPRTPGTPVSLRILDESPVLNSSSPAWSNKVSETDTSREDLNQTVTEDEGTIALRTRSKLPLTETSLVDIEEAFVAPDITPDLYDTNCDDEDWKNFLSTLYKTNDDSIADDEVNDPEFNYIAEVENDHMDDEDFRFDKPTKISRKELNILIEELHDLFDDEVLPYQVVAGVSDTLKNDGNYSTQSTDPSMLNSFITSTDKFENPVCSVQPSFCQPPSSQICYQTVQKPQVHPQFKTPHLPPWQQAQESPSLPEINCERINKELVPSEVSNHQRALIEDNLRKHIQLLAQTFLQVHKEEGSEHIAGTAKDLLLELQNLRQSSHIGTCSVFNVCNLDSALSAVNTYSTSGIPGVWDKNYNVPKSLIYGSPAFLYTKLLPSFKFSRRQKDRQLHCNNKFLPSENNLIALGLEQFSGCQGVYPEELIQKLLIRGKTVNQIYHNVRFLSSSMAAVNPVKKFKRLNMAVELDPPTLDTVDFRAPQEKDLLTLPDWCKNIAQPIRKYRSQINSPLQLSASTSPSGSATPSSFTVQSIQTSVINNSANNIVLCNQIPRTESVYVLSSQVSSLTKNQSRQHRGHVKGIHSFRKILPSKSTIEKENSKQLNTKLASADEMSIPKKSDDAKISLEDDPIHAPSSTKDTMSDLKNDASPESGNLNFHDSPSGFSKVLSPTSASTPNGSKRNKPPSVRNLGPEFDKHDNPTTPDKGLNIASASQSECNQTVSAQGAFLIDPDLILPHSPPKKVSKTLHKVVDQTVPSKDSCSMVNICDTEVKAFPIPVKSSTINETNKTVIDARVERTSASMQKDSNEPLKGTKTLQLTVIENPSFHAIKRGKTAISTNAKTRKGRATSGDIKKPELQSDKDKGSKMSKTNETTFSSENLLVHESKRNVEDTNKSEDVQKYSLSTSTQPPVLDKNIIEIIGDFSHTIVNETTKAMSDTVTLTTSGTSSCQSSTKDSIVTSQSPTIVVVTGNPVNKDLSMSPASCSAQLGNSPVKIAAIVQVSGGMKTPPKLPRIAPKEVSPKPAPAYEPLPKISPKRKELNRQVRNILPKSFTFEVKNPSPTKATAMVLKKRALCQQRSPLKILPRLTPAPPASKQTTAKGVGRVSRMFTRSQHRKAISEETAEKIKSGEPQKDVEESESSEVEESGLSQEEEEENEDQIKLEDLMAASTTISFASKHSSADDDTKGRSKKKKELALLQSDLVESDPKKDERDIAFAQCYFDQVKEALKNDPDRFRKFLDLLKDMNKNHRSPVELYADIVSLLSDHQQLVEDFAGFLLSFQALECECFTSNHQISQIRRFLRQIEVHCGASTSTFKKALQALGSWLDMYKEGEVDVSIREKLNGILKNIPGVLDDLICYFLGGPLPDCQSDDFEDVNMLDDLESIDEFEEVVLPNEKEKYNTARCSCQCHTNTKDRRLLGSVKHCVSCSLKMFKGQPVFNMSKHRFHPIRVLYPLEEKEKLIKAKKEAAQIALAKARALRKEKAKKRKQLKKLKSKEKGTGKLKRKRRRNKATKKSGNVPQPPEKKTIKACTSSRRGSIKIQINCGTARLVTDPDTDSVQEEHGIGGDSSAFSDGLKQSTQIGDVIDVSNTQTRTEGQNSSTDKILSKLAQTSNKLQNKSASVSRSTKRRRASHTSPEESHLYPPSKKQALSSAIETDKQDSLVSDSLAQSFTGQQENAISAIDDIKAFPEESGSCLSHESCLQVEDQSNDIQTVAMTPCSTPVQMSLDGLEVLEANEDFDRCILSHMSYEGITEEGIKAVCDFMPNKSVQEVQERAMKLLEMLDNMSEATTTDVDDDEMK